MKRTQRTQRTLLSIKSREDIFLGKLSESNVRCVRYVRVEKKRTRNVKQSTLFDVKQRAFVLRKTQDKKSIFSLCATT